MKMKSISLATALALASTAALAQANAPAGNPQAGAPAPKATTGNDNGAAMKDGAAGTTGSSRPSPKDASTQGAGTAGAVDKKGEAASPGGTMKK
jgi:hypothetical protein